MTNNDKYRFNHVVATFPTTALVFLISLLSSFIQYLFDIFLFCPWTAAPLEQVYSTIVCRGTQYGKHWLLQSAAVEQFTTNNCINVKPKSNEISLSFRGSRDFNTLKWFAASYITNTVYNCHDFVTSCNVACITQAGSKTGYRNWLSDIDWLITRLSFCYTVPRTL